MNCPNCNHEVSVGAGFCGNCGQPIPQPVAPVQAATPVPGQVPVQPVAQAPVEKSGSGKAVASLVLGILGFVGALIPIIGLIMGITALVLGITSKNSTKKGMATAGLILGIIVIILSLVFWGFNIFVGVQNGEFGFLQWSGDYLLSSFDLSIR